MKNAVNHLRAYYRLHGAAAALRESVYLTVDRFLSDELRRHATPHFGAFVGDHRTVCHRPEDLLAALGVGELAPYRAEFEEVAGDLAAAYARHAEALTYPAKYQVETGTSWVLYALVRSLRPSLVLETGVANGHSTFVILRALRAVGQGVLHSTDIRPGVGGLLEDEDTAAWVLHVLDDTDPRSQFRALAQELPGVDLFFHDSLHTHRWQSFEYSVVARHHPGSLLVSDDVDRSYAFLDFCAREGLDATFLLDPPRIVGATRLAGAGRPTG